MSRCYVRLPPHGTLGCQLPSVACGRITVTGFSSSCAGSTFVYTKAVCSLSLSLSLSLSQSLWSALDWDCIRTQQIQLTQLHGLIFVSEGFSDALPVARSIRQILATGPSDGFEVLNTGYVSCAQTAYVGAPRPYVNWDPRVLVSDT